MQSHYRQIQCTVPLDERLSECGQVAEEKTAFRVPPHWGLLPRCLILAAGSTPLTTKAGAADPNHGVAEAWQSENQHWRCGEPSSVIPNALVHTNTSNLHPSRNVDRNGMDVPRVHCHCKTSETCLWLETLEATYRTQSLLFMLASICVNWMVSKLLLYNSLRVVNHMSPHVRHEGMRVHGRVSRSCFGQKHGCLAKPYMNFMLPIPDVHASGMVPVRKLS